jgi:hypothetical protein
MITSPVLRGVLVLCLGIFVWAIWAPDPQGAPIQARLGLVALTVLAAIFAVGLVFPTRARWALRVVAGIGAGCLFSLFAYRVALFLVAGPPSGSVIAVDSPLRTGFGLLIWGVPLLIFALSGRSSRERATDEEQKRREAGPDEPLAS